jgi:hypothetical protein
VAREIKRASGAMRSLPKTDQPDLGSPAVDEDGRGFDIVMDEVALAQVLDGKQRGGRELLKSHCAETHADGLAQKPPAEEFGAGSAGRTT